MLADRSYMRRSPFDSSPRSVTVILIAVNIAIYVLQLLLGGFTGSGGRFVNDYLALSKSGITQGYVWQLLTFQFLHAGPWPWHLLFNCLGLYFFGREVEHALGRRTFTKLYFLGGFAGGILFLVVSWVFHGRMESAVVGASAGVSGILAAFAVLFPMRQITILVMFVIPVSLKAKYLLWGMAILSLYGTLAPFSQVAHAAHLGGLLAGYCYLRWGMQAESMFMAKRARKPRFRPRELVKVSGGQPWTRPKGGGEEEVPPAEFISREVDPILDKISAHGIHSLTPEERQILEAARARMGKGR